MAMAIAMAIFNKSRSLAADEQIAIEIAVAIFNFFVTIQLAFNERPN